MRATIPTKILICLESFSTLIVRGDLVSGALLMLSAILPISVLRLMLVTMASARPVTTVVPEKSILVCSAMEIFSSVMTALFLTTLRLSPVRMDSLTVRLWDSIMRISALILSPDSRSTKSPMVRSSASIDSVMPPRMTLVLAVTSLARASAVWLALFS